MVAPVSACLIVRDEASSIVDCLASLSAYVAEMIVVDTGSRDATPALAHAAGAVVSTFEWTDSFADARNAALERATQPYILVIDADERLMPESARALLRYCAARPTLAGRAHQVSVGVGAEESQVEVTSTRLFPNDPAFRYAGRVHEQILYRGQPCQTIDTGVRLLHLGYTDAYLAQRGKVERNVRLLQRALQDAPAEPYLLFQLGRTLHVGRRYAEAARYLDASLESVLASGQQPPFLASLLLESAFTALRLGDPSTALRMLEPALELFPDFTDAYFALGSALLACGDPNQLEAVREAFEACLTLGEADSGRYETLRGVGSFRAQHNLGLYHELRGDRVAAAHYFALAADAGFEASADRLRALRELPAA